MTAPLTPDQARNWFSTIYSITERSTPITMVFILVTGALFAWYVLGELRDSRGHSIELYNRLLLTKDAQLSMAMDFADSLAKVSLHCNVPMEQVLPDIGKYPR